MKSFFYVPYFYAPANQWIDYSCFCVVAINQITPSAHQRIRFGAVFLYALSGQFQFDAADFFAAACWFSEAHSLRLSRAAWQMIMVVLRRGTHTTLEESRHALIAIFARIWYAPAARQKACVIYHAATSFSVFWPRKMFEMFVDLYSNKSVLVFEFALAQFVFCVFGVYHDDELKHNQYISTRFVTSSYLLHSHLSHIYYRAALTTCGRK
jgi:hypothetical protein